MMRLRMRARLACCALVLACGCGGATQSVQPKVLALPPADPIAAHKYLEACALLVANKHADDERAAALLNEALAIDSYLWEAHYNLGVIHRRRGELRKAQAELEAAHKGQPGAGAPLLALAETEEALGQPQQASDLLTEYLKLHEDALDVRVSLTALLREQGQYEAALEQARAVLVRDPKSSGALLEVGRIYRARGELDVAELVFGRALHLDEKSPRPHNELGLTALARGDTQLAFERFEEALKADKGFAPARLNRAAVLLRAGDYKAAEAEYRRVLAEEPSHEDARVGLAIALRGQSKHAEAASEYETVLSQSPNNAAALFDLAILRAEFLDRRADARELFERFLAVAGEGDARNTAERYLREMPESAAAKPADKPAGASQQPKPTKGQPSASKHKKPASPSKAATK
jgi:tetratricopeptide (TPR) repeat protein